MISYKFTLAAEEDLRGIWHYSHKTWGTNQAERYLDQIETCCKAISDGRHDRSPTMPCLTMCESTVASITTSSGSQGMCQSSSQSFTNVWAS